MQWIFYFIFFSYNRHENYEKALEVMKQATKIPKRRAGYHDNDEPVQCRVYRSIKLWSFYADLEESFGSVQVNLEHLYY